MMLAVVSAPSSFHKWVQCRDKVDIPDKLVTSVSYQFDTASPAAPNIKQVAAELDGAKLANDDGHGFTERVAQDFGMETRLQPGGQCGKQRIRH